MLTAECQFMTAMTGATASMQDTHTHATSEMGDVKQKTGRRSPAKCKNEN